jgi:protein-S-isoprenylcysteine O-methyltransferase Ste14
MSAAISEEASSASHKERIDRMHKRDRMGAIAFVLALWIVVLFVLFSIWPSLTNSSIRSILIVSGIGVLILNTAAIIAMLRHYDSDKHFIYSLDIMHLDEMRKRRRAKV